MFPCLEISDLCNFEVSLWWTLLSSTRAQASWGLPSSLHLGCGHIFLECLLVGHDVKSFCFRWPSGCNPPGRCTFKDSLGTARSSWPGWPRSCSPIMEELKYFLISLVQFYFKLSCLYFTGPGCCQLGLSTRRRGAQLEWEFPRLFNIITLILELIFMLLNASPFSRDITVWSPAPLPPTTWSLR